MANIQFNRPIGPHADMNELEYITSLHQTLEGSLRMDATIDAMDISKYLTSRHGIQINEVIVQDQIIQELCGTITKNNNNNDVIDVCQIVSLLIIPYLRRQQQAPKTQFQLPNLYAAGEIPNQSSNSTMATVYDFIKNKAKKNSFQYYREHKGGIAMTPKLLQEIFDSYGESDIPLPILQEMVIMAGGDNRGVVLTPQRFEKALTADVQLYQPNTEGDVTTHFEDAVNSSSGSSSTATTPSPDVPPPTIETKPSTAEDTTTNNNSISKYGPLLVKQFYTAPSIDYTAGSYRSPIWVTLLWICGVTICFSYLWVANIVQSPVDCGSEATNENYYGCTVGAGVLSWVIVFFQMAIFGFIFVFCCSLGNFTIPSFLETNRDKFLASMAILWGMIVMVLAAIMTFVRWDVIAFFIDTTKTDEFASTDYLALIIGSIIMLFQLVRIVTIWLPNLTQKTLFFSGTNRMEMHMKQAATFKVDQMVDHALMLHYDPSTLLRFLSSTTTAARRSTTKARDNHLFDAVVASHGRLATKRQQLQQEQLLQPEGAAAAITNHYNNYNKDDETISLASSIQQHFQAVQHIREERTGGVRWAFSRIFDQSIFQKEGIWFHSRLITCNILQLMITIFVIIMFAVSLQWARDEFFEAQSYEQTQLDILASNFASEAVDGSALYNAIIGVDNNNNNNDNNNNNNNDNNNDSNNDDDITYYLTNPEFASLINSDDFNDFNTNARFMSSYERLRANSYNIRDTPNDSYFVDLTAGNFWVNSSTQAAYFVNQTSVYDSITNGTFFYNDTTQSYIFDEGYYDSASDWWNSILNGKSDDEVQLERLARYYARNAVDNTSPNFLIVDTNNNDGNDGGNNANGGVTGIYYFENYTVFSSVSDVLSNGNSFSSSSLLSFELDNNLNNNDNDGSYFVNMTDGTFWFNRSMGPAYFVSSETIDGDTDSYGTFLYNERDETFFFDEDYYYGNGTSTGSVAWWEFSTAFSIGFVCALFVAIGITAIYIPSSISTILKFRSGALPSLHDPIFLKYRTSQDTATILLGCCLWGTLFSAILTWFIISSIVFLTLWSGTRELAVKVWAQGLGIVVTVILKVIVFIFLRKILYSGFYRTKTTAANLVGLALECWNIALAVGYMVLRSFQLIMISAFYIGRLDTPLFAPGIGCFGPMPIDTIPITFRKDILIQEAHHHPYIERLGLMYLMKLRHGKDFGSRAGSYWRLLFVLALMPWMRAYRSREAGILDKGKNDVEEALVSQGVGAKKKVEMDSLQHENQRLLDENERMRKLIQSLNKTEHEASA